MPDPASALVTNVFDVLARVRHARVFHPNGIPLAGRFRAVPAYEPLFGSGDRAVIGRLSKGTGLPDGVPDVLGLAIRILDRDDNPWDFALATTGQGNLTRFAITVARGWKSARYGTLLPYRLGDAGLAWIFAEPTPDQPDTPSLGAMEEHLREHLALFELKAAGFGSAPGTFGELSLRTAEPGEYRTDFFDPMLNHPPEVGLVPNIVARVRELAYTGSRHGRGEEN